MVLGSHVVRGSEAGVSTDKCLLQLVLPSLFHGLYLFYVLFFFLGSCRAVGAQGLLLACALESLLPVLKGPYEVLGIVLGQAVYETGT